MKLRLNVPKQRFSHLVPFLVNPGDSEGPEGLKLREQPHQLGLQVFVAGDVLLVQHEARHLLGPLEGNIAFQYIVFHVLAF